MLDHLSLLRVRHTLVLRSLIVRFRRPLLFTVPCFAALAVLASCSKNSRDPEGRPDVYVIVIDTMRADRLGCYGYWRETSPFLDELAAEGTVFLNNTAQSSWTLPSMVSLFSGRYITTYRGVFPEDAPTLAESFQASGYRTIGVVGNVLLSSKAGFDRGFDVYDARQATEAERAAREQARLSTGPCRGLDTMRAILEAHLEVEIERRENGEHQPLFVYLHPMEPHAPYERRPAFEQVLASAEVEDSLPTPWHQRVLAELGRADEPGISEEWARMNRDLGRYDWEVRYSDWQLEFFFEGLRDKGLLDNAIIAIVADHGEELFDHLDIMPREDMTTKPIRGVFHQEHGRTLHGPLVRTPFILWGVGVAKGAIVDYPVENVGLFPTLLELAGVKRPEGLHSESLVRLMSGEAPDVVGDAHSFVMNYTSIREGASGLKLILPSELGIRRGGAPMLFDLKADPWERENIYDVRPADVARMTAKIETWRENYPNETSIRRPTDPETLRNMRALGYFGDDEE